MVRIKRVMAYVGREWFRAVIAGCAIALVVMAWQEKKHQDRMQEISIAMTHQCATWAMVHELQR